MYFTKRYLSPHSGYLAGTWPQDLGSGFSTVKYTALIAAIETEILDKFSVTERATMFLTGQNVKGVINAYMDENMRSGKTFNPNEWDSYWKPTLEGATGYNPKLVYETMNAFYLAHQNTGLVPPEIWNPKAYVSPETPPPSSTPAAPPIAWGTIGLIAVGGLGLYSIAKKGKRRK